MAFNDDNQTKRCHLIGATISIAFFTSSPYFDPAIQLPQTEPGLITEHDTAPHGSGSIVGVADTSANGPDGEGQSLQASG